MGACRFASVFPGFRLPRVAWLSFCSLGHVTFLSLLHGERFLVFGFDAEVLRKICKQLGFASLEARASAAR